MIVTINDENTKWDAELLLHGTFVDLCALCGFLVDWSKNPRAIAFSSLDFVELRNLPDVMLVDARMASNIMADSHECVLMLDPDGAEDFARKVKSVCEHPGPAHTYLDTCNGVTLLVSKEEYGDLGQKEGL